MGNYTSKVIIGVNLFVLPLNVMCDMYSTHINVTWPGEDAFLPSLSLIKQYVLGKRWDADIFIREDISVEHRYLM